jgi:hypothetical protein
LLTRLQVADRLGVSLSTVRRLERSRLPAVTGADGVHRFDPAAVAELAVVVLAAELAADPAPAAPRAKRGREGKAPRNAPGAPTTRQGPPADLPAGELAGRVFERLEQRQSLAEIVVGLRVPPALVRELHREWQRGLVEGELEQLEPVLPAGSHRRARERFVDAAGLAALLAELPMGARTRISVARNLGDDDMTTNEAAPLGWGELRRLVELGGFLAMGPIPAAEISRRYGAGDVRITAYGFDPPGVRWEVFATIDADAARAALVAVELPPVERPALSIAAPIVALAAPVAAELPPTLEARVVEVVAAPIVASALAGAAPASCAPVIDSADAAEPWGDGVVSLVLGGRGLRAELAAAVLSPSSASARPSSPLDALPAEWIDLITLVAPRVREPDPSGLPLATVATLAQCRARLAAIPPVVGHALVALRQRLEAVDAATAATVRVLDPGAPLWKAVRKRLASDHERDVFDLFLADESGRRSMGLGGGNDPDAAVCMLRVLMAMGIAHEIDKVRGAASGAKEG